jgi:glyoxylase-like metal-dependent hydrolase (beta-lactamase superfamily II)
MSTLPDYEIFCVKYGERPGRRPEHFIGGDPHDAPMPMDYFVWLVRNQERTILVDTGFTAKMAIRGRVLLRTPAEGLALIGAEAAEIRDVIITHLHNDHVGTFYDFPNACFHLQDREMQYVTGRHMLHNILRRPYEVDEVVGIVRLVYQNRVAFHDGEAEIAPGISVHHIGGHTMGLQSVRVHTRRGWVVLASTQATTTSTSGESLFPLVSRGRDAGSFARLSSSRIRHGMCRGVHGHAALSAVSPGAGIVALLTWNQRNKRQNWRRITEDR